MIERDLPALRQAIDTLDNELVRLLDERASIARAIGDLKRERGAPYYVPERERAIVERLTAREGAFPRSALRAVLRETIAACLSLERPLRVGYVGPEGSLAQAACRRRFGVSAELLAATTASAVLADVASGSVDLGVIAAESTEQGMLSAALDALASSTLSIVGEIHAPSSLTLLSKGGALAQVTTIVGTEGALQEAGAFLVEHLRGVRTERVASDVVAMAQACGDDRVAALAPAALGLLLDLALVVPSVGHAATTRYLLVGRDPAPPTGQDRTSLLAVVANEPAGLHRLLGPFAERGINLFQIEPRPGGLRAYDRLEGEHGRPFDYVFFLDVEGHATRPPLADALAEVRRFARSLRLLGSYPREPDERWPA